MSSIPTVEARASLTGFAYHPEIGTGFGDLVPVLASHAFRANKSFWSLGLGNHEQHRPILGDGRLQGGQPLKYLVDESPRCRRAFDFDRNERFFRKVLCYLNYGGLIVDYQQISSGLRVPLPGTRRNQTSDRGARTPVSHCRADWRRLGCRVSATIAASGRGCPA